MYRIIPVFFMQVLGIGLQAHVYMSSVAELYTWPESLAFKEHGVTGSFGLSIFLFFLLGKKMTEREQEKQHLRRQREIMKV